MERPLRERWLNLFTDCAPRRRFRGMHAIEGDNGIARRVEVCIISGFV